MKKSVLIHLGLSVMASLLITVTGCSQLGTGAVADDIVDTRVGRSVDSSRAMYNVTYCHGFNDFKKLCNSNAIKRMSYVNLYSVKTTSNGHDVDVNKFKSAYPVNDSAFKNCVQKCKDNGVRIMFVFGGGADYTDNSLTTDSKRIKELFNHHGYSSVASTLKSLVKYYDDKFGSSGVFYGLDLDWELSNSDDEVKKWGTYYKSFVDALVEKFGSHVTIAAKFSEKWLADNEGASSVRHALDEVRFINLMNYGFSGTNSNSQLKLMQKYADRFGSSKICFGIDFTESCSDSKSEIANIARWVRDTAGYGGIMSWCIENARSDCKYQVAINDRISSRKY